MLSDTWLSQSQASWQPACTCHLPALWLWAVDTTFLNLHFSHLQIDKIVERMNSVFLKPGCGACGCCVLGIILPTHWNPHSSIWAPEIPFLPKIRASRGAQLSRVPPTGFSSLSRVGATPHTDRICHKASYLCFSPKGPLTFLQIRLFSQ